MVDEALRGHPGSWRDRWAPAIPLLLVQLANGIWYLPQISFFPIFLQERLGLTTVAVAAVVAGGQLTGMVVALLGGAVGDRLGSKWTLVVGMASAGLASLVFQARTPWLAAALWSLSGVGLALQNLGGGSYLTRLSSRRSLGLLSALYALSTTVGGALANPGAGLLLDRHGYAIFGLVLTGFIATVTAATGFLLPHLEDQTARPVHLASFWRSALPIVRRPIVRLLIGMRCLPTLFYGVLLVLVPLLLNDLTGSKTTVAAYATTNLVVASAAQLVVGRAADRFGARGPTLVGYAALIAAGLGLALTAGHVWGLFAFGVLGIAAAWVLSATMYLWVADGVPQSDHAWAFGLLHSGWSLSMVTGSLLGGWLVRTGAGLPFLVVGLCNVGSLFLTLAFYRAVSGTSVRDMTAGG